MDPILTQTQRYSLELLLLQGFTYSSALHASLFFGNDFEASLKFLTSPIRDKIQVFAQNENNTALRISLVLSIEESKKTTLLDLIGLLEKKLNTSGLLVASKTKNIEIFTINSYLAQIRVN